MRLLEITSIRCGTQARVQLAFFPVIQAVAVKGIHRGIGVAGAGGERLGGQQEHFSQYRLHVHGHLVKKRIALHGGNHGIAVVPRPGHNQVAGHIDQVRVKLADGAKIEQQRKSINMKQKDLLTQLQIKGIDLNASGLSKLEGQLRYVTDFELKALSEVLGVTVNFLLGIN